MRLALGEHDGRLGSFLFVGTDFQAGSDGRRGEEAANPFGNDAGDGRYRQLVGRR